MPRDVIFGGGGGGGMARNSISEDLFQHGNESSWPIRYFSDWLIQFSRAKFESKNSLKR